MSGLIINACFPSKMTCGLQRPTTSQGNKKISFKHEQNNNKVINKLKIF